MAKPGEYVSDVTEGITRVEDLPKAKVKRRSRTYKKRPCPHCGHSSYRDKVFTRTLHDLGYPSANRPVDVLATYSQHCCCKCNKYFNADLSDLADPGCHYMPLNFLDAFLVLYSRSIIKITTKMNVDCYASIPA